MVGSRRIDAGNLLVRHVHEFSLLRTVAVRDRLALYRLRIAVIPHDASAVFRVLFVCRPIHHDTDVCAWQWARAVAPLLLAYRAVFHSAEAARTERGRRR